jgi:hypothetical protein
MYHAALRAHVAGQTDIASSALLNRMGMLNFGVAA